MGFVINELFLNLRVPEASVCYIAVGGKQQDDEERERRQYKGKKYTNEHKEKRDNEEMTRRKPTNKQTHKRIKITYRQIYKNTHIPTYLLITQI